MKDRRGRGRRLTRLGALVTATIGVCVAGCGSPPSPGAGVLEVDVRASRAGTARLYLDTGQEFSPDAVVDAVLADTRGQQTLHFPVVPPLRMVRFDPFEGPGKIAVLAMRFVRDGGGPVPLPIRLRDIHDIATLVPRGDGVHARTTPQATDPWLVLATPTLSPSRWAGLDRVTAASLLFAATVLGLLFVVATFYAWTWATAGLGRRDRLIAACVGGAVICLVVGAKLWVIRRYGSAVPFLDEWADHARATFLPFSQGDLRWQDLLRAHNEHRHGLPRILALALLLVDGQWNAMTATAVNAVLHAWAGAVLVLLLWRRGGRRQLDVIALVVVVALALPFASENSLWGFASCFYLLLLTLLLPLALVPDAPPGSRPWLAGILLLGLAPLTNAGGMMNAGCVLAAVVLDHGVRKAGDRNRLGVNVAACTMVGALGVLLLVPTPANHLVLRARSSGEFLTAALSALAWPAVEPPELAALAWAPMAAVVAACSWQRRWPNRLEAMLAALGAWLVVQAGAVGYSRGASSLAPVTRYQEILSLGFVVNATAATYLLRSPRRVLGRWTAALLVVAWFAWAGMELAHLTGMQLDLHVAVRGTFGRTWETNIRRFLRDGDHAWFARLKYPAELPVGDPALLSELLLVDPFLGPRMPSQVRPTLPVVPAATGPFRRDATYPGIPRDPVTPAWGSYGPTGDAATGEFKSEPMACSLGRLLGFQVVGHLGVPGMRLFLEHEDGRRTRVNPLRVPGLLWRSAYVRCPPGTFRVVARDRRGDGWFAFQPPLEYGAVSAAAGILIRRPWAPLALGLLLTWIGVRRQDPAGTP